MQVVDSGRLGLKEVEPPAELKLGWYCGDNHLPDEGGINKQDAGTMFRMRVCQNIYNTLSRYRNMRGEEIHSLTNDERIVLRTLKDNGLWSG